MTLTTSQAGFGPSIFLSAGRERERDGDENGIRGGDENGTFVILKYNEHATDDICHYKHCLHP